MAPPSPSPPRPRARLALALLAATLLCTAPAHAAHVRLNVGGPELRPLSFIADATAYLVSPTTAVVAAAAPLVVPNSWKAVYGSYRYAFAGDLTYKLPVPPAVYKVALMFAETFAGTQVKGARRFNVLVNGKVIRANLDVFHKVGANKPLYISAPNVNAPDGFVTVTIQRILGAENPMLSGIVLIGDNPGAIIKSSGSTGGGGGGGPATGDADPQCATGIFAKSGSGQLACCEKACGKCGGNKCGKFAPGKPCCVTSVNQKSPSCDDAPPPCVPSKDLTVAEPNPCAAGIFGKSSKGLSACCEPACPKCGGAGCGTALPGSTCCVNQIARMKKSCDDHPPPCVPGAGGTTPTTVPPTTVEGPKCSKGIPGWNKKTNQVACCPIACRKCGGNKCNSIVPGISCCITTIFSQGKPCSKNAPPCVPDFNPEQPSPSPEQPSTCPISGATKKSFRMNIASGVIPEAIMGADNEKYVTSTSKGAIFSVPSLKISAPSGAKPWDAAYSSHRYTFASVLSYSIPVPEGSYIVKILFAETYFDEVGKRTFDLFVNGVEKEVALDVYARVGMRKGLLLNYRNISPVSGRITIAVIKISENPMISAIMVEGKGAGDLAKGGGCTVVGDDDEDTDFNSGFNHRAHSVPGGPYIATDFAKQGFTFVSLDGTQSHSHYSDPGPPSVAGKIVSYKWTWSELVGGTKVSKSNSHKSGKFTASFPLGKTTVFLEAVDNTGDVAVDETYVEVKESTGNGAYCYWYDFKNEMHTSVPLGSKANSEPKPLFGETAGPINFANPSMIPDIPFAGNAFAVRCTFFVNAPTSSTQKYTVSHNGPFQLYHMDAVVAQSGSSGKKVSKNINLSKGLNPFQLLYFRPKGLVPKLVLSKGSTVLSATLLQHDSSAILPVIEKISTTKSPESGGGNIQIYGSGFVNGVSVKFGKADAQNLISSDAGTVQVTVPPGSGKVSVIMSTNAGVSNEYPFVYTSEDTLEQPVIFEKKILKGKNGAIFDVSFVADVAYGPDGRLYLATTKGHLYALEVNKDMQIKKLCLREIGESRAILGLAFDPRSKGGKMFFTSSTLYWKDYNLFSFEEGWPNGKVESIDWNLDQLEDAGAKKCAGAIKDVVTGLPVSNHDHGINKLQFLPDGRLLVSVGSFTNGGISVPGKKPEPGDEDDDALGGVSSNPLSASIIACPPDKVTNIKYDNYVDPEKAKITSGKACKLYATGIRNSFGMVLHTNGQLYATDNGHNAGGFGDIVMDCDGTIVPGTNVQDKLFSVEEGGYHGHPNLNRGECEYYPPTSVQPLTDKIESSSSGILEYRSNTFGGAMKDSLYMSQFAGHNEGKVSQGVLSSDGKRLESFAQNFLSFSGVAVAEGPRGEIVMAKVYKESVLIAIPVFPKPKVTFMLGVHPKRGPATGGTKVLISGFKFGTSPTATFDGKPCKNVKVVDDQAFTCNTPAKTKGLLASVVVTGTTGESPSYGTDFWYW